MATLGLLHSNYRSSQSKLFMEDRVVGLPQMYCSFVVRQLMCSLQDSGNVNDTTGQCGQIALHAEKLMVLSRCFK